MPYYPADWVATMQPALFAWVDGVLGALIPSWTTTWGRSQGPGATEQGPAPAHPFASISCLTLPIEDVRTTVTAIETGALTMTSRVRTGGLFTFSVQLLSRDLGEIVEAAGTLQHSIAGSYPYVEALEIAGLVPGAPLPIRDISDIRGARREFRHLLEVPMRVEMRTDTPNAPWIETVTPPVLTLL